MFLFIRLIECYHYWQPFLVKFIYKNNCITLYLYLTSSNSIQRHVTFFLIRSSNQMEKQNDTQQTTIKVFFILVLYKEKGYGKEFSKKKESYCNVA